MMLDEQRNELRGLWRGKRKDNEEWVKGTLLLSVISELFNPNSVVLSLTISGTFTKSSPLAFTRFKYPEFDYFEIITNTLGECAGVRDKKKVPIFEGDIVKVLKTTPKKFEGKIGIVEWVDEAGSRSAPLLFVLESPSTFGAPRVIVV